MPVEQPGGGFQTCNFRLARPRFATPCCAACRLAVVGPLLASPPPGRLAEWASAREAHSTHLLPRLHRRASCARTPLRPPDRPIRSLKASTSRSVASGFGDPGVATSLAGWSRPADTETLRLGHLLRAGYGYRLGNVPRSESRSDPSRSRQRRGARARPDATRRDALVGGTGCGRTPEAIVRRGSSIPWIPIRSIARRAAGRCRICAPLHSYHEGVAPMQADKTSSTGSRANAQVFQGQRLPPDDIVP